LNDVGTTAARNSHSGIDESFRNHLPPLFLLASIFLLNFSSRIILAPLLPALEKDLALNHSDSGSLFLFLSMGYFISLLGSGHISSRISHKKTVVISAIFVGISLSSISFVQNFFAMRCCVFFLGISSGIYLPSGITAVTSMVHPKHWGKAVAIHELAPNLSFIITPLLVEMLLQWFLWRHIMLCYGIASIVLGAVFFRYGKGGLFLGKAPNFKAIKPILKVPDFWMLIVLFGLAITSTLGIYNMLPLYLTAEHRKSLEWANNLVGISRIPTLGMSFLAGLATDSLGAKTIMVCVFLFTGILTLLLGMVSTHWVIVAVFLQPILAVCFYPAGFSALSAISAPENRNVAVSLTIPIAFFLGAGAVPALIGTMADFNHFSLGISLSGLMILTGFIISFFLKLK
jgi:NNP family nitrate/nitrite transporter-like MFS transporter